jgi:hypothetical protein
LDQAEGQQQQHGQRDRRFDQALAALIPWTYH